MQVKQKPIQLISQSLLWQAKQRVENSNSYSVNQQQEDDFMRKMRHALANGNISAFKELTQQNQETKYDYNGFFINKYKSGPFHMVCENGRHSLIRHFTENNLFQINEKIDGMTPLMLLTLYYIKTPEKCTSIEILELMFENGADPLIKNDKNGLSVYDFVKQFEDQLQQDQELNFVLQYILEMYKIKQRQQALKNAILLQLCNEQQIQNNLIDQFPIINYTQIFEFLIGKINKEDEQVQQID